MEVDFKVTVWERIDVPTHLESVVEEKLKNGEIESSLDLIDFLEENGSNNESNILYDTIENMTISENSGNNTIEAIKNNSIIFKNI